LDNDDHLQDAEFGLWVAEKAAIQLQNATELVPKRCNLGDEVCQQITNQYPDQHPLEESRTAHG
jgi:hypothetical protein